MSNPIRGWLFAFVSLVILVSSCGTFENIDDAVSGFVVPAEFVLTDDSSYNGPDELVRQMDFSTDLSGAEACELGKQAMVDWGGEEPVDTSNEMIRGANFCWLVVATPSTFPEISMRFQVARAREGTGYVMDENRPLAVRAVVITFFDNK